MAPPLLRRLGWAAAGISGLLLVVRGRAALSAGVQAMAHASPWGALVAVALAGCTYVFAAMALRAASGRSLPLGRTALVQLSGVCANRITPAGIGAMATNARYLEADGASRSQAVAAISVSGLVSMVVHVVATAAALAVLRRPGAGAPALHLPAVPGLVVLAGVLVLVAGGADSLRRHLPKLLTAVGAGVRAVRELGLRPRRLARLATASAGGTLAHALAFAAASGACGVRLPVLSLVAVFLAGSAVAAAAPTPGGLGSTEAALVAGLSSLGVAGGPAVAAVLTFRFLTYWLPVLPSAGALWLLRRRLEPVEQEAPTAVEPAPVPLELEREPALV
jgi:uncharacterized membrane protein YbhN (UPF0104 family)